MEDNHDNSKSICTTCEFRFRRVFIPSNPSDFEYSDGESLDEDGGDMIIMNMCIAIDMDLDLDSTVECSHYKLKKDNTVLPFFRHI
jgi:hypothetical protein